MRCLDPAVSFRRITTAQPRSIILSSGTLGSLAEWQKALGYAVKVQLSITSFITPSHLHAQIIKKSQNGRQYDFSYNKKHIDLQYEDLVEDLKQVETRVDSGIVVAFSNY